MLTFFALTEYKPSDAVTSNNIEIRKSASETKTSRQESQYS